MRTEFGTDIETALTECDVIHVREDGQAEESTDHTPPSVFVVFKDRDEDYDPEDIQVDGDGDWELGDLGGKGFVSHVQTVHPAMVEYLRRANGTYALVSVEGTFPEWVFGASDREIGTALLKLVSH